MEILGPMIVALVAVAAWGAGVNRRRAARVRRAIDQVDVAIRERRIDDAERALTAALEDARDADQRAALLLRLGTVYIVRGAHAKALVHLESARGYAPPRWLGVVFMQSATANAFAGNIPAARAALEQARAHLTAAYARTQLVDAEAIVALRSGEPERAATMLESATPQLEAQLTESQMKGVHLLIAFARSTGDPRYAADVERHLALARSDDPHRFDAFTSSWPEMRAFCAERLSGR